MTLRNTAHRWGPVSQLLHWLVVLLILTTGILGLVMGEMRNSPTKIEIYALHKSLGLTILALAVLRLAWRSYAGAPLPPPTSPRWQHRFAAFTHWLLYGLLFAIPLSGWTFNSAAGYPLQWFKLFNLPALVARDAELRQIARDLHEWLFLALLAVAVLHAAAAWYHHLVLRDDTLRRMLPRLGRRQAPPSSSSQD